MFARAKAHAIFDIAIGRGREPAANREKKEPTIGIHN
jgi:hypothetical protein